MPSYLPVGWKSRDGVPVLVEKYLEGNLKVEEFITHTMPLADINTAFDLMHKGERCVFLSLANCVFIFLQYS